MPRAAKVDPFTAHVRAASGKASAKAIGVALGKLVAKRLASRVARTVATPRQTTTPSSGDYVLRSVLSDPAQQRRRRARRSGRRVRYYTPTSKVDVSRLGTFRHYMLRVIRAHSDTRSAELEHSECDNPKFAKNRLDFNWAADNGYIDWA